MLRNPDYKGVNIIKKNGAEIYRLVSGDPNIYEGGWDTPKHLKDAVIRAIKNGYNMYPNRLEGLNEKLIDAIIEWEITRDLKAEACIDVNPGSNYGAEYSMGHFRIPYLPGEDKLNMIYDKLESFMKKRMS
jgi:aspartate/methionine/tyrosine aminotransferase